MSTTSPLTLDLAQLSQRYAQLQAGSGGPAGFGDEGGSLYFISAGSEYRLHAPQCVQVSTPLSAAAKQAFVTLLNQLQTWVTNNVPADQQAADLARIQAGLTDVNSNTVYTALQIDTTVDHIRGSQPDDHARVVVQLIWSPALGSWLPILVKMGFTWAQADAEVPDSVMQLLGAPNNSHALSYLGDMIDVLGDALEAVQIVEYAAEAWNVAVGEFSKVVDDGGRAYFPVVVSEAFTRILLSVAVTGASASNTGTTVTPDLKKLGQCWVGAITSSEYTKSNYSYLAGDITIPITNPSGHQTSGTYQVSLPDLLYLDGGAGTLVSFKLVVQGSPIFATILMFLDSAGHLHMATGVVQHHDDSVTVAPVSWGDGTDTQAVIEPVTTAFAAGAPTNGTDSVEGQEFALPGVLWTYMLQLATSLRQAPASGALDALPQLPGLMVGTTYATVATGRQRPAVAVAKTGYALCLSCDPTGSDEVWADMLSTGSTSVILYSAAPKSYQKGQDPAITEIGVGETFYEVHGGNGNNNLYSNEIGLPDSTPSIPSSGSEYGDGGENPAIATWGSHVFELHRDGNSDSDTLYWMIGTTSGGPSGTSYAFADGDNVAATVLPGTDIFVASYVRDGMIRVWCATAADAGLTFPQDGERTVLAGDGPAVVGIGSGVVLMLNHGTDAWSDQLQYGIGVWDDASSSIQWLVLGVGWKAGRFPAAAVRTDGAVVIVTEGADSAQTIYAYVANVTMPEGFLG